MHQTTVRFSPDLWEALSEECSRLGVSAAQFVREAALARLSYIAGRRGDLRMDAALEAAAVNGGAIGAIDSTGAVFGTGEAADGQTSDPVAKSTELKSDGSALTAQSRVVIARAQAIPWGVHPVV
jgi:hypothetical protein